MAITKRRASGLALTAAGASAALLLAGCSGDPAPTETTPGGDTGGFAGVELTVWNNIPFDPFATLQEQYFQQCAEDLGITVTVETLTGSYNADLLQAASSNTLPDVVQLSTDTNLPQLAAQGVLTDLSAHGITTDGQLDSVAELGRYDGTLYGLVTQVESFAVFYDQAAFAEAGIEEFPTTFAELVDVATELTTADRYGIALPGAGDGSTPNYFLPFLLSAGGDPGDPQNAGSLAAIDLYGQLASAGALSKEFVNWGWDAPDQWKEGRAVITVTGPWELVNDSLTVDYATAQFPTLETGATPVVNLLGYGYGVPVQADENRVAAAAALVACRAEEEKQLETAIQGGYIPALTSAQQAFVAEVPTAASYVDAVPGAFNAASLGTEWFTLQQVYVDALQDVGVNGVSAEQAVENALAANQ